MTKMGEVWLVFVLFCLRCFRAQSVAPYEEAFLKKHEVYTLPRMPYKYSALEPFIDEATLKLRHLGHHAAHVKRLNELLKEWRASGKEKELASESLVEILKQIDKVPTEWQHDLRNHAGGYFSHSLYVSTMSPNPNGTMREPGMMMSWLAENTFETLERFEKWVKHEALGIFGSGNLWICVDPNLNNFVALTSLLGQDTPFAQSLYPILVVDVWEHAYYLKHQNNRAAYLEDWWKVVNWDAVETLIERWGMNRMHDEL